MVGDEAEALDAARELGFPVVVKVDAKKIVHKTDVGGVALDLGEGEVSQAVKDMKRIFTEDNPRFLVQEFLPGGKELIIGAKSNENAGHLLMFGMGGIYVEAIGDVSFGMAPITSYEAKEMIQSIKSYELLTGYRGGTAVNQAILIEMLQRVSQLTTDFPEIKELDLNPVISYKDRVVVADARIRI
jgi:acetyltransferase